MSPQVSHDIIVSFVLGELSEPEAREIEKAAAIDKEVAAKIELLRLAFGTSVQAEDKRSRTLPQASPNAQIEAESNPGERLREARLAHNLTIEELAQTIRKNLPGSRLDAVMISAIEAGQEELDVLTASTLASSLGTAITELVPALGYSEPTILLKQSDAPKPERTLDEADKGSIADVERELGDFLPLATAREMIAAWKQGQLRQWISDYVRVADDYGDALVLALASMSLTKDHTAAAPYLEKLVEHAGTRPERIQDAHYLRGRGKWYLKKQAEAVQDLQRAIEAGAETQNPVRLAQAEYYLGRVAIVAPKLVAETADVLLQRAEDRARHIGRPDLELLAKRGRMIWYRNKRQHDQAVPLGRELLDPQSRWASLGMSHILDNVRTDLGVSLRGLYTEEARQEAERCYQHGINRGRDDSHAGMCLYLTADLYVDRMVAELQQAAEERSDPAAAEAALQRAYSHRRTALSLCEHAQRILQVRGDKEALEKANRRLVFLETSDLVRPTDETAVVADYAVRVQRVTELFLGAPRRGTKGPYSPGINELGRVELEQLLGEYFSGLLVMPGRATPSEVSLDDFLRPNTLLCLPWLVGSSLVVRVLGCFDDPKQVVNVGWFVLRHYANEIRPGLARMRDLALREFLGLRHAYFGELQKRVETIDPMTRHEHPGLRSVRDVIVLSPQSNQEWLCPVEWLRTGPGRAEPGVALLDYAAGSLVFATTARGPFAAMQQTVPFQQWRIVATTQQADDRTIYDHVRQALGPSLERWDAAAPFPGGGFRGVMVIAHADDVGSVERALAAADLSSASCVALLFCSSGQYSLTSGPFVDGVALQVRSKLPPDGLVIGARVPVSLPEAIRFATELRKDLNASRPVTEVVTGYLHAVRFYGNANPFDTPWVVLS